MILPVAVLVDVDGTLAHRGNHCGVRRFYNQAPGSVPLTR